MGYDCRVRERAGLYGLDVFSEMAAEDVAVFFCAENMLFTKDKSGKNLKMVAKGSRTNHALPLMIRDVPTSCATSAIFVLSARSKVTDEGTALSSNNANHLKSD